MDEGEPDVLAFVIFPKEQRAKLLSTNPIERLNDGIKRRTDVVGTFTHAAAISPSARLVLTAPMTRGAATPQLPRAAPAPSYRHARTPGQGWRPQTGRPSQERHNPRDPPSWPYDLTAMERLPPTKSGRDQNAVLQAAGRACYGARLRQAGRRTADQGRYPEPLHRPGNAANSTRGMSPFKGRENSASGCFVQQSPTEPVNGNNA